MAAGAQLPTVDGQCDVHANVGGTASDMTCTFTSKDADVTGTCESDQFSHDVTGKVDGKTITWQFNTPWEGQTLTVTYSGTLDGADKMKGTVDVQPLSVTGDFTAARGGHHG